MASTPTAPRPRVKSGTGAWHLLSRVAKMKDPQAVFLEVAEDGRLIDRAVVKDLKPGQLSGPSTTFNVLPVEEDAVFLDEAAGGAADGEDAPAAGAVEAADGEDAPAAGAVEAADGEDAPAAGAVEAADGEDAPAAGAVEAAAGGEEAAA